MVYVDSMPFSFLFSGILLKEKREWDYGKGVVSKNPERMIYHE